ncbi:MAG: hypothetical protein II685_08150 [Clostridia bacterium]|nr:hypothetical protein [Clostridia bacterium]
MQYLAELRAKYMKLMDGKYGLDKLNRDLFFLWFIIGFLNNFFRSRAVSLVSLLLPMAAVLRMFSTSVYKRSNENRKYLELKGKLMEFFKILYLRIKERKTHKYYKCKNCSAYFRVKRKPGEHFVDCPKCGKEIKVKIRMPKQAKEMN